MDEETSKFMANTKDVDVMKYSDMKLYIETRYLEELGRKVINPEKKTGPVSGLEESEQDPWLDYSYGNDVDALKEARQAGGRATRAVARGPSATDAMGTATWPVTAQHPKGATHRTSARGAADAGTSPATTRDSPRARARAQRRGRAKVEKEWAVRMDKPATGPTEEERAAKGKAKTEKGTANRGQ